MPIISCTPAFAAGIGDQVALKATHQAGIPLHQEPCGTNDFLRVPDSTRATVVFEHVLPVCWLPDGTGVVDQSVPTPSLFNAVLNDARDIPTTGEVRLHRHGLDALVQNRSNRLTCAIVGVAVVPRSIRLLLAQSTSHCLADAAI